MNTCSLGQPFGMNYNPSYGMSGLLGHSGCDWGCGFGSIIHSPVSGVIYKILTIAHPSNDGTGFTGVFILCDNGIESFEFLIGHCDPSPSLAIGQAVQKGDVIGTEANHGTVYSGNIQITLAMQKAGDQRGHHRHYQKRPFWKSKTKTEPALSGNNDVAGTYRDEDGYYYNIFDYHNGFNGCVDPTLPVFNRDLEKGKEGYDVYVLQRMLQIPDANGHFGPLTYAALVAFQKAHSVSGTGYCGPVTRAVLNKMVLPVALP